MCKRAKGPRELSEWEAALTGPLTYEKVGYLLKGKCRKGDELRLFNLISDYVVNTFNSEMGAVKNANNSDILFALTNFCAKADMLLFYLKLDFLPNKRALTDSLDVASKGLGEFIKNNFGSPDAVYFAGVINRKFEGTHE